MTDWDAENAVEEALSALRMHDASGVRVERIRARCVAELAARAGANAPRGRGMAPWRAWLEPALALGLGALYLAEVVSRAMAVYR